MTSAPTQRAARARPGPSRIEDPAERRRVYAAVAALLYVVAIGVVLLKPDFDFVVSDGRGYYAYLSSFVVDGDLDFENQIREHWGVDFDPSLLAQRTPIGRIANIYPIGLALTLAPAFVVAHVASLALHGVSGSAQVAPDGYSVLYQLACLAMILALCAATMTRIDRLLVEELGTQPAHAMGGVLLYWLGTHYAYYAFREPFMVHAVSTFWVTLSIGAWATLRHPDAVTGRRLVGIGLAAAMAIVCRPTNAIVLLPFGVSLLRQPELRRGLGFALAGALLPIALQLLTWKALAGRFVYYSYEQAGFAYWASPHLFSTLFSSKQGLFFWSPILLFAAWGIAEGWRVDAPGRRALLIRLGVGAVGLWYANSAWHIWNFGDAFGARAFLELSVLFVCGLAWMLERAARMSTGSRRLLGVAACLCVVHTYVLMALYVSHRIPRSDFLF